MDEHQIPADYGVDESQTLEQWWEAAATRTAAERDAALAERDTLAARVAALETENKGLRERLDAGFEARARRALGDPRIGVNLGPNGPETVNLSKNRTALGATAITGGGDHDRG